MTDPGSGGKRFVEVAAQTFAACGAPIADLASVDAFELGEDETVVVLGLVGGWRGAVAFRFDAAARAATAEAMAGEPVDDAEIQEEALLEAVNVVAGRGAAALAEGGEKAVWLTPPLLAKGPNMSVRLMNLSGDSYSYGQGGGSGGVLFSAAPAEGGHA